MLLGKWNSFPHLVQFTHAHTHTRTKSIARAAMQRRNWNWQKASKAPMPCAAAAGFNTAAEAAFVAGLNTVDCVHQHSSNANAVDPPAQSSTNMVAPPLMRRRTTFSPTQFLGQLRPRPHLTDGFDSPTCSANKLWGPGLFSDDPCVHQTWSFGIITSPIPLNPYCSGSPSMVLRRLAASADRLSRVVSQEVPGTLFSLKLSVLEIQELTQQLASLRRKSSASRYVRKSKSSTRKPTSFGRRSSPNVQPPA